MEILKQGYLPENEEYQLTCTRCGTVFKFFMREARAVDDARNGMFLSIRCPLTGCGNNCTTEIKPRRTL